MLFKCRDDHLVAGLLGDLARGSSVCVADAGLSTLFEQSPHDFDLSRTGCQHERRFAVVSAFFDHTDITARCDTCHQKSDGHIVSSNDCEICHNTREWDDVQFDHSGVTVQCATCHSGDLPSDHFRSTEDCAACHLTTRWSPDTFGHTSPDYPGTHAGNLDCTECHQANTDAVLWPRAEFRPDCAGCHASDFERREHTNKETGLPYTTSELRDCTLSCHVEDDGRPEHRVNDSDW